MRMSALHRFSFGYVVAVRDGSPYTEVCPIEPLGFLDGEVNASVSEINEEGVDGDGNKYTVTMSFGNSLSAKWLPGDTNRITPPDVRVGEPVMIYRMADSNQYFWKTLGLRNDLRRLETVIYAFSATEDEVEELDHTNCYFFEISSHAKQITLSTSKANGEPFAYVIQLNTGDGSFTIKDDAGNSFLLDSAERRIKAINGDGSFIDLNKRNGWLNIPDTYKITCKDYLLEAKNSITEKTKTALRDASASNTVKTVNHVVDATASVLFKTATITGNAPTTSLTGVLGVTGAITAAAGTIAMSGGNVTMSGGLTAAKGTFKGNITSFGKNVGGLHTHPNPEGGNVGPPV